MRWIVRLLGLLIVVALLAVVSVFLLPGDRIAKIAADQISNMTGRQVTMTGDTTVSFYPVLGISTGAVTVANADWAGDTPMFQAESLKIGVEPQALFGGDIRITGLEAIGPQINLRRDKNGRVNWELGVEGVAPSGQSDDGAPARSSRLALTLDRALIQNASFSFVDELNGTTTQQSGVDFDLRWPDYEGAAEFELGLQPAGERVSVTGKLERVGHFISGGVSDVVATVSTSAGTANFTGKAGSTPEFAGTFSADAKDTSALMVALGLGPMEIPRGLGRAAKLDTSVTFTNERRLSLRDTRLQLDGNAFTGAADVDMSGAKPRLNVQLNAGALDLTGLSSANNESSGSGSSASSDASSGWSKSPINASGLGAVDGEFALVADSIDLGDFNAGSFGYYFSYSLFFLGILFLVSSTFVINHFELFGLQQSYLNLKGRITPSHSFTDKLYYKLVRHPIYTGLLFVFWSTPHMSMSRLALAVGMTLYIYVGIYFEEKDLISNFGYKYEEYKKRVPKLIPFLRKV